MNFKQAILECRDIKKSFIHRKTHKRILKNISIKAFEKEITLITGKSGAGKSVLLWILSGVDSFDSGKLTYHKNGKVRKGIIFQNFNLVSTWTVEENIKAGIIKQKLNKIKTQEITEQLMTDFNIIDKQKYFPFEISMGQQQRTAIARTLASEPDIIFADEPTASVDPETAKEIIDILKKYVQKNRKALVVTSHFYFPPSEAESIYYLKGGTIKKVK